MTKKSKNRYQQQSVHNPTAPVIDHSVHHSSAFSQPPNNPYYPDLESTTSLLPPPPYSDLSTRITGPGNIVPMTRVDSTSSTTYPILPQNDAGPTVIVHRCDVAEEIQISKIKKFNNELGLSAVIVIIMALVARSLYESRTCVDYLVYNSGKSDSNIMFHHVRDAHLHVAVLTLLLFMLSVAKCSAGSSRSYRCYLLLVGIVSFVGTLYTGFLAYLAFYTPCTANIGDIASNVIRTLAGAVTKVPSPDKGFFGEVNVYERVSEDPNGHYIFMIDLCNFVFYIALFLNSIAFC